MAVKKTNKEVEVKEEKVVVDTTETVEVEPNVKEEVAVEVEPEVVEKAKAVKTSNNGNVRIRALKNHHCFIGGEHYYLEAGQCYNVPANVKEILNRAGLLAPL